MKERKEEGKDGRRERKERWKEGEEKFHYKYKKLVVVNYKNIVKVFLD